MLTSLKWVTLALVTLAVKRMVDSLISTHVHDHDQYPVKLFVDVAVVVFFVLAVGIFAKTPSVKGDIASLAPKERWVGVIAGMGKIDPYLEPRFLRRMKLSHGSVRRLRRVTFRLTPDQLWLGSFLAVLLLWPPITVVIFAFLWALIP